MEEDHDFDYYQDIARAGFGDMLHDIERNQKYFRALKIAIDKKHALGQEANVLDIGTGTGLLSMMAVNCGADTVTACEGFNPMAECAQKIMDKNRMLNKIKLIPKRSTEIQIGEDINMMNKKANILVTEVFDTDLIGECAIQTFVHAHKFLLEKDCIVVPDRAIIYAQIIESPLVSKWRKPNLLPNLDGDILIKTPPEILNGVSQVAHDLQMSQLPLDSFTSISGKVQVMEFDWSGKTDIPRTRKFTKQLKALKTGVAQAVFVWWDLKMDEKGDVLLSCAPYWEHPEHPNEIPWRDHWMQAIYYLPEDLILNANDEFALLSYHNDYLLTFNVTKELQHLSEIENKIYEDAVQFYAVNSRTRIGQLNDTPRNKKYISLLEDKINKNSIVLAIGDFSLISLAVASLDAKHLYILQENHHQNEILKLYINYNNLKNVKLLNSIDEIDDLTQITQIISEPYFDSSILLWNNFKFGNIINNIKNSLNNSVEIIPKFGKIYAMPVEFKDLQKISISLGICENFNMDIFDELIMNASKLSDANIEAQPLWEYPCRSLGKPKEILHVDFANYAENKIHSGTMNISKYGKCNGIVFWTEFLLDGSNKPKRTVSTGPVDEIICGEFIKWNMYNRQGVLLFRKEHEVEKDNIVDFKLNFDYKSSDMLFECCISIK